jgi:hypothetical protein
MKKFSKIKTSELIGSDLDWAVAKCEGKESCVFKHKTLDLHVNFDGPTSGTVVHCGPGVEWSVGEYSDEWFGHEFRGLIGHEWNYSPTANWAQGGPIIERESISISRNLSNDEVSPNVFHLNTTDWLAQIDYSLLLMAYSYTATGPTPLIAAMRCFVASKLGETVEIPEELK